MTRQDSTKRFRKRGSEITFQSIGLYNGKVLPGEKIEELVSEIINKFAESELSYDEARIILNRVESILGESSIVQKESK